MTENIKGDTKLCDMDMNNSWALNMVASRYIKQTNDINNTMFDLINAFSETTNFQAKALYNVAGSLMLESTLESVTHLAGGAGGIYASRKGSSIENEVTPEYNNLTKQLKEINGKLNGPNLAETEKKELMSQRDEIKSKQERLSNKLSSGLTKANSLMQVYKSLADGFGSFPQGMQKAQQQEGQATKSIMDTENHQTGTAYENVKATLKSFLDIDYFSGLITLANIQLK